MELVNFSLWSLWGGWRQFAANNEQREAARCQQESQGAIFLHQGLRAKEQVSGDRTDILTDSTASTTTSLLYAVI